MIFSLAPINPSYIKKQLIMPQPTVKVVDTVLDVQTMLDSLADLPKNPPSLFIDLEGVSLSRYGSISILQIYVPPISTVYLVDIHVLRATAFDTPQTQGPKTLRSILQCENTPKVFFDCRNDSDALYAHYRIALKGVVDVQLLELATRRAHESKLYLRGLSRLIQDHCNLSYQQKLATQRIKDDGLRLFHPDREGSYEVFNQRPLPQAIIDYCAQDVTYLPELRTRVRALHNRGLGAESHGPNRPPHRAKPQRNLSAEWGVEESQSLVYR